MDDTDSSRARQERQLDEALRETFPASDPVSIRYIGASPALPLPILAPTQARQRLARYRLRHLIDQHGRLAQ